MSIKNIHMSGCPRHSETNTCVQHHLQ